MNGKLFFKIVTALLLAVCMFSAVLFGACSSEEATSWDVSADGGSVTASFEDNGKYGFILNIEGNGKMRDFGSAKDAPWYGKSGRITDIVIADGVTSVGSNAFTNCAAKSVILPESVTSVGSNAFPESAQVFALSKVTVADGAKVYVYSEKEPATSGLYWHYINGSPVIWKTKVTKVLFIGNSFTFYSDIPALFGKIATAAGELVEVDSVTQSSYKLTQFADPADEYGAKVEQKLTSNSDYDAVVLQEQSTRPLNNYDAFLSGAQALQKRINETQTDCAIYLYSTWGYIDEATSRNITIPEMEAQLRAAYKRAADTMGVKVSNVGAAFSTVYTQYPDMLKSGTADNNYNLYYSDNKHPSYIGAFLSACVHVAAILDCDPRISAYSEGLDAAVADYLKNVAYTTVFGY